MKLYKGYIYKITNNINKKIYIGKTTRSVTKRWNEHIRESNSNKDNNHFHNAIRKYGEDSFEVTILDTITETTKEQLDRHLMVLEKTYIEHYDSFNNGYNETLGGDGVCGRTGEKNSFYGKKHSAETKKKIGEKSKERNAISSVLTKQAIEKRANTRRGVPMSEEQKIKLSQINIGRKQSQESIERRNHTRAIRRELGMYQPRTFTEEYKMRVYKDTIRKILQFDIDGNLLKEYDALFKVNEDYPNIDRSSICKCCRRKIKTCGGYIWRYSDDCDDIHNIAS